MSLNLTDLNSDVLPESQHGVTVQLLFKGGGGRKDEVNVL